VPSILEKVQQAENLPTLPTVAVEVLRLTRTEYVTVSDLAEVVQNDPALTAKILKVVNSSLFGMPRKISSVQQAMVVLGMRTVKVMALSFSLVDTMGKKQPGEFDYQGYWRRSLTTAVAARLLAEKSQSKLRDEAFVAGLLADIGMLAALRCAPGEYRGVLQACAAKGPAPQVVEQQLLGFTHAAISARLLQTWRLPDLLSKAVGAHHGEGIDELSGDHLAMARILRSAAAIADLFCQENSGADLGTTRASVRKWTALTDDNLTAVLEAIDTHVKNTASLFNLDIGSTRNYAEIQNDAVLQLAQLSVAAELERAQAAQQVQQLSHQTEALKQQATTDALTQIGNRASFDEHLKEMVRRAARAAEPVGLIMLDIDHFKKLNDTFGHQTGDAVLREVGRCLGKIHDATHFAARYGGEEFAIIVANATAQALRNLAEETRLAIQKLRIPTENQMIGVTASLGAALLAPSGSGRTEEAIIRMADACLYKAKHGGRNRVVCAG
jgi:diguanylate cyclase (GGDEF)-like protein